MTNTLNNAIAQLINQTIRLELTEEQKLSALTNSLPMEFSKAVGVPLEIAVVWFKEVAERIEGAL